MVFVEQLHDGGDAARRSTGALTEAFGLRGALRDGTTSCRGDDARRAARRGSTTSALLVNISGHLRGPELLARCRLRAFVDLDPGYTQIWHAEGHDVGLGGHDLHFTVGANVGTRALRRCRPAASAGDPIRQPVVLDRWPAGRRPDSRASRPSPAGAAPSARSSGTDARYGVKAHEFRALRAAAGGLTGLPFADRARHPPGRRRRPPTGWRRGGWQPGRARDGRPRPPASAATCAARGAEFSVAQGVYVRDAQRLVQRPHACATWRAAGRRSCRTPASAARCRRRGAARLPHAGRGGATGATRIVDDYDRHRRGRARSWPRSCSLPSARWRRCSTRAGWRREGRGERHGGRRPPAGRRHLGGAAVRAGAAAAGPRACCWSRRSTTSTAAPPISPRSSAASAWTGRCWSGRPAG